MGQIYNGKENACSNECLHISKQIKTNKYSFKYRNNLKTLRLISVIYKQLNNSKVFPLSFLVASWRLYLSCRHYASLMISESRPVWKKKNNFQLKSLFITFN